MKRMFCVMALLISATFSLSGQDISGDWQGTLGSGRGGLRLILHIDKAIDGSRTGMLFSIDQTPEGFSIDSVKQQGMTVVFYMPELKVTYKGIISSDGRSIAGKYTQNGTVPLILVRPSKMNAWPRDIHCACKASFVPVAPGVKLEVLDWGGSGRPLVLLAGLGYDAHDFDNLSAKLIAKYHVYGITRRGFGASSSPPPTEANYSADRLGDDVLRVIDALHLRQRPVLVGHSIAGEELSSIGSRYPEKVAGLVYLDAGYGYAFYDRTLGDLELDAVETRQKLEGLLTGGTDQKKTIAELMTALPKLEKELKVEQAKNLPSDPPDTEQGFGPDEAIELSEHKYTELKVPVLAIFADPHDPGPMTEYSAAQRAAVLKDDLDSTTAQANVFEAGVSSARVVRIPNADHFVFKSNEADVLREMNLFMSKVPN